MTKQDKAALYGTLTGCVVGLVMVAILFAFGACK